MQSDVSMHGGPHRLVQGYNQYMLSQKEQMAHASTEWILDVSLK